MGLTKSDANSSHRRFLCTSEGCSGFASNTRRHPRISKSLDEAVKEAISTINASGDHSAESAETDIDPSSSVLDEEIGTVSRAYHTLLCDGTLADKDGGTVDQGTPESRRQVCSGLVLRALLAQLPPGFMEAFPAWTDDQCKLYAGASQPSDTASARNSTAEPSKPSS